MPFQQLKLMYITNRPDVAAIAQEAGVDRIFVDMEYIGKALRQGGMDTVQSHHTPADVAALRPVLKKSELMVRVNPIHESTRDYCSSREEIDAVIAAGADVVMLPYFKTVAEVAKFIEYVDGRAVTFPLLETPEAAALLDDILKLDGIDEMHIGFNDLSLGMHRKFMFELLADGTVDALCGKLAGAGIPYGFGGIASPGKGALPAEYILREHVRLGSSRVILSRSFCNTELIPEPERIREIFLNGVPELRMLEQDCSGYTAQQFADNHKEVVRRVQTVLDSMNGRPSR